MIPDNLRATEMGRDMLAQDYLLKQLAASLIYPEKEIGKEFWDKVRAKAKALYGTSENPVNTYNKVWVVADRADVFEHGDTAYVVKAHLKVMLDGDYLALKQAQQPSTVNSDHSLSSQILREIVLPDIEKEINEAKNFVPLRQMYYSMILASWYKIRLKNTLFAQVYGNKSKVGVGVNIRDSKEIQEIYERYVKAFKQGVFNYIK